MLMVMIVCHDDDDDDDDDDDGGGDDDDDDDQTRGIAGNHDHSEAEGGLGLWACARQRQHWQEGCGRALLGGRELYSWQGQDEQP